MTNDRHQRPADHVVEETEAHKQGRGRPVQFAMPDRIDATPEEIAEVVLGAKPKTTWRYEEDTGRKRTRKAD